MADRTGLENLPQCFSVTLCYRKLNAINALEVTIATENTIKAQGTNKNTNKFGEEMGMEIGLPRPIGSDKLGPKYSEREVNKLVAGLISAETYFYRRAGKVSDDLMKAVDLCDKWADSLNAAIRRVTDTEAAVSQNAKKAAGRIRDSAQRLGDGLAKLEKTANFERLERLVVLLERAESAISALAEMESSGELKRIASALRD